MCGLQLAAGCTLRRDVAKPRDGSGHSLVRHAYSQFFMNLLSTFFSYDSTVLVALRFWLELSFFFENATRACRHLSHMSIQQGRREVTAKVIGAREHLA